MPPGGHVGSLGVLCALAVVGIEILLRNSCWYSLLSTVCIRFFGGTTEDVGYNNFRGAAEYWEDVEPPGLTGTIPTEIGQNTRLKIMYVPSPPYLPNKSALTVIGSILFQGRVCMLV